MRDNLSKSEREAIKTIIHNDDVIIKEADKGSALCITNKEFYEQNMLEMLKDGYKYEETQHNMDSKIMCKIKHLIKLHIQNLTKHENEYLTEVEVKTSNLYGLPKVHKSNVIIDAIKQTETDYVECHNPPDFKFRPIVAGPACPTHRLTNLIDIFLRPYIKHVKSYVRDDNDFLNHLPNRINENVILCTFDVSSLYTNISHQLGLEAIAFWIDNYTGYHMHAISKRFILEGHHQILENNTFCLGSRYFRQTSSTAWVPKWLPHMLLLY